ncbi:Shedu immune nuclease family protein [Actinomycetospora sp. NBRC 106378]|uniref:Shedu immune nuclease family protein n=1 Tax=Actinomycetospora sp. NBRC 106378 TaxID=3032208 RepID=UPI0024A5953A|nr:Shedu immune nuclease family protein [Actinomycetospora sp. NBRC 106378]GLZ53523.1 hypothetical protein Acsp07_31400 [Actinomycetospora sp. NBRC 106378]
MVEIDPYDLDFSDWRSSLQPANEVTWAKGRSPDRTYIHASFTLDLRASRDRGQPARYVVKVFDELPADAPIDPNAVEWTSDVVRTSPGGRKQIKLQIAKEAGQVRELIIQRVPADGNPDKLENILTLNREEAARLIELVRILGNIPVEGGKTVRLDDQTIRDFFADPDAVHRLYARSPQAFREVIENDPSSTDLVAIAHRRSVVDHFRSLLHDSVFFEDERRRLASEAKGKRQLVGAENVWQAFFEANPWILGVGLAGQLLTSWDSGKLEQVVAGFSVAKDGKRTDTFLRTTGSIGSLVFVEIKPHEVELLGTEYRAGCWSPSQQLSEGVAQIQQTVMLAATEIGERLAETDEEGAETGEAAYLVRPRSFLIIGNLKKLKGDRGGVHRAKYRSFELYRRNLYEPEVLTFDEVLARAEWHVILSEAERSRDPH